LNGPGACRVLIIGDCTDPHVRGVTDLLPVDGVVVLDGATISRVVRGVELDESYFLDMAGRLVRLNGTCTTRGWIRRLTPAGWDDGVQLGSHPAAVLAARLGLLGAVVRDPAVNWISPVDRLVAAENKITQYRAAASLGLRVPDTMIGPDPAVLARRLGEPFVMKPLGPGNFETNNGTQRIVYATSVTAGDLAETDLLEAPFLAQEHLSATKHLRIVTVRDQAWIAVLDSDGLPCDWRKHGPAHHAFQVDAREQEVGAWAVTLAESLGVGYSSQDWLVDHDGPCFLDLNPGGQWLFLPDDIASAVSRALAGWLAEGVIDEGR